jgi:hypothetical protein
MSAGFRQTNTGGSGYFINVAAVPLNAISSYNPTTGQLSTALWSQAPATQAGLSVAIVSTQLATAGTAVFRDMGRTVVSSNRTFRKVQLQLTGGAYSTSGGIGGRVGTTPSEDYFTGYVELGFEGQAPSQGVIAPLARFGR